MNEVQFKFTLNNTTSGIQQIEEPIGWDDTFLKLERDKEFHGIIEFYDQPLTFPKGDDLPGGFDYAKNIFETQGPDADITLTISISNDNGESYEEVFSGLLDLSTYLNIDNYKVQCSILRNDLWSKFYNRRDTSINFKSSTDLDGGTRQVLSEKTLTFTSQKVRQTYLGHQDDGTSITYTTVPNNEFGWLDFGVEELAEIGQKFTVPRIKNSSIPSELFAVEYAGSYAVTSEIYASTNVLLGNNVTASLTLWIQVNENSPSSFSETSQGTDGIDGRTRFSYSGTLSLNKGDRIKLYWQNVSGGNFTWDWFAGSFYDSFFQIVADTTYPDTTGDIFLIHEAFQSVTDRIIGNDDTFYSEYLGRANTQRITYGASGCGSNMALCRGVHIRGYDISDKIFSASFNDLWRSCNPIFNLGLQTREISGEEKIEILKKDDLYESGISIYLNYVNNIEESADTGNTFKNIKIGYEKWEAEDYSGIDDPQTKREYATPLKKIGEEITLYSKAIAASLAIESTRRQGIEKGADYKLDNDLFIIALDESDLASSTYTPDLDDDFSSITDLLNSTTRYNLRLTPVRNFLRWYRYFNGAFYGIYNSNSYRFVAGEGNYDMAATQSGSCPGSGTVDEGGNISMGTEAGYHSNKMLEFEHPLSWDEYKTIRDNKNKKIMVSSTNANHDACYIDSIEYQLTKGIAKFKLWKV